MYNCIKVTDRLPILTLGYTCVQILHTLMNNNREYVRFDEWQIGALAIPVSLNSAEHRCTTFWACFIFIKLSSINYDWEATFAKKTVGRDLTRSSRHSSVLSGMLWLVDALVAHSPPSHSNSALTTIYYYKILVL